MPSAVCIQKDLRTDWSVRLGRFIVELRSANTELFEAKLLESLTDLLTISRKITRFERLEYLEQCKLLVNAFAGAEWLLRTGTTLRRYPIGNNSDRNLYNIAAIRVSRFAQTASRKSNIQGMLFDCSKYIENTFTADFLAKLLHDSNAYKASVVYNAVGVIEKIDLAHEFLSRIENYSLKKLHEYAQTLFLQLLPPAQACAKTLEIKYIAPIDYDLLSQDIYLISVTKFLDFLTIVEQFDFRS